MSVDDETRPEVLQGGPLDGHEIDARPSEREVWPGPHHLRAAGLRRGVCYRRGPDGKLHYDPTVVGEPVPTP